MEGTDLDVSFAMRRVCLAIVVAACGARPAVKATPTDAFEVMAVLDRLPVADLWPGFDPSLTPVAIYDGTSTWLFRHPSPPAGFVAERGALRHPGRHEAVRANASATLGGVEVATLLLDGRRDALGAAGTVVHESFHVFQRRRHPGWVANELDYFTTPFDDVEVLTLRRAEAAGLDRSLDAGNEADRRCWAFAAVGRRKAREVRVVGSATNYERAVERFEGLAQYVEHKATGRPPQGFTPEELPTEKVRERAYAAGEAWAVLLDDFSPGWRETVENGQDERLDELVAASVGERYRCQVTNEELDAWRAAAEAEIGALHARRAQRRKEIFGRDGWTLSVVAGAEPLWPQGFDPWNLSPLEGGELVHERWLKLGNRLGAIEVLDRPALTEAAGDHPLAEGVSRLTVTGLGEPVVREAGGKVTVEAAGVKGELAATVVREGRRVELRLR